MSTTADGASILVIPEDLVFHIFSFCTPQDIWHLRECCKHLEGLSRERTVWIEVFKKISDDLHLFTPSFPLDDLADHEVEVLATSWIRLLATLRKASQTGVPPTPLLSRHIPLKEGVRVFALDQLTGGRFLVALTNLGLQIWDLFELEPKLVCFEEIEIGSTWSWTNVEPGKNEDVFICAAVISESGDNTRKIYRFTAPPDGSPQLELVGVLELPYSKWRRTGQEYFHAILGYHILSVTDENYQKYYIIWDFVNGGCAAWPASSEDDERLFDAYILVTSGYIVAISRFTDIAMVYSLPQVPAPQTYAPRQYAEIVNPLISRTSPNHVPVKAEDMAISYFSCWRTSFNDGRPMTDSIRADWLWEHQDGSLVIENKELSLIKEDEISDSLPPTHVEFKVRHRLRLEDKTAFPIALNTGTAASYTYPDETRLLYSLPEENSHKLVFFHSSIGDGEMESRSGIFYDPEDDFNFDLPQWVMCGFGGRLSVLDSKGIKVLDFVKSPYLSEM
ncbi:hypothetical protein DL96DRAFT_1621890 [Flagelloscypha sp. PMI_526]|nr:hypothetical protein DL96DRAFT_1621890 [Flagelloscypha sp. PMI_526]